ncbi:MAG: lysophospholipid acyltransferase family protein [Saprospiraceae bacterium]
MMQRSFSYGLYWILFYLLKYRRRVVASNLKNSFPLYSKEEIKRIEKGFYKYLAGLIIETFILGTFSADQLLKKVKVLNYDLLEAYLSKGTSCFILTAHFQNWEYAGTALGVKSNDRVAAVFKPLKNKWFNQWIVKTRTKFGSILVSMHDVKKILSLKDKQVAIYMVADQTPSNTISSHWVNFLNQKTAFFHGAEKMAKKMNIPVFFAHVDGSQTGGYLLHLELITDEPQNTPHGWITEKYAAIVEAKIKANPSYWLWSHKRWKLTPDE